MELSAEQGLWLALAVSLGVGYLVGLYVNRRRGQAAYRWLAQGLRQSFDGGVQGRWLGSASTGARLSVQRPGGPFRQVEVAFLLQTRELWPLWLVNRLRGKGDQLVLRVWLRHGVPVEWEMGPARGEPPGPDFEPVAGLPLPPGWRAWARGSGGSSPRRPDWTPLLQVAPRALLGLSLRRGEPHLIVRLDLNAAQQVPAQRWFEALKAAWRPG